MAPLLKTAESAGAPLALTCSVLDEMQAMQRKGETTGREGGRRRKWQEEWKDRYRDGGREVDEDASGTSELLQQGGGVEGNRLLWFGHQAFNCLLRLFLQLLPPSTSLLSTT